MQAVSANVLGATAKPVVVQAPNGAAARVMSASSGSDSHGGPGPSSGDRDVEPEVEMEQQVEPPEDANHLAMDAFQLTLDRLFLAFEHAFGRVDPQLQATVDALQKAISASPLNGTAQGSLAQTLGATVVFIALEQEGSPLM
jgi:hypothetical protein